MEQELEEQVKVVKNMTDEQFAEKKKEVRKQVLDEFCSIKEEEVLFDEALYQKNVEELKQNEYNFETEDGE